MTRLDNPFTHLTNLADPAQGGAVISVSDEFFGAAKRMLATTRPQFIADLYDDNGKWMDGWESRRKRTEGHDFCILRICTGAIHGIEIDTANFTGNFAPAAMLEACFEPEEPTAGTSWETILPRVDLAGDRQHFFEIRSRNQWTHLRLNIYPDGGIARFRVYGIPSVELGLVDDSGWIDLASALEGGKALQCNDMHFGDMANLIKPGQSINMGDGWETRRRRAPGNDWVILALGKPGVIRRIEIDTSFFKGNNPARCSLRGHGVDQTPPSPETSTDWPLILPPLAVGPDQVQLFQREIITHAAVSHVRLDIFPDGGVARLRLFGEALKGPE